MFYRRKIALSLIEAFGGSLQNTDFQKLLFILSTKQGSNKSYHFVPYRYGSFSFQANADHSALSKLGYLQDKAWTLTSKSKGMVQKIDAEDRNMIIDIKQEFKDKLGSELVRYVYINYPYFAINSEIASEVLSKSELERINEKKPQKKGKKFFTIGYEGKSLEEFLNSLIVNGVKVLCDVRKNALSRKYGFSKKQLDHACKGVGIQYIHVPELGISSENRKNLDSQDDYKKLFSLYEKSVLPKQMKSMDYLSNLVHESGRVAISCFESSEKQCHRGRIASALQRKKDWEIPIHHL